MAGTPVREAFPVTEVVLVSSRTDAAGPTYEVLERFPLR